MASESSGETSEETDVVRGTRWVAATVLTMLFAAAAASGDEQPLYFTLLHTNDEHSAVLPAPLVDHIPGEKDPTTGGFARLGRLVGDIRAVKKDAGEPVVLVSAGDILGGAPLFWLIPGGEAPEISIMQQIGYDVITIGNNDFDYGPETLAQYYRVAGYPEAGASTALVSSNLVIPQGHPLGACGIAATRILELDNGLRLGFFGLLGDNAAKLAAEKTPIDISEPIAAATTAVKTLQAMKADVIIGVTHAGRDEDEAVASAVPGIDLLITGHFHPMALDTPIRVGNTIIAQSSPFLGRLGVLELACTRSGGKLQLRNEEHGQPYLAPIDDSVEEDPAIARTIAGYTEQLNLLVTRLTRNAVTDIRDTVLYSDFVLEAGPPGQESILGSFVTDAMRLVVEERTGEEVDFAIQGNGVIRDDVRPGAMPSSLNKVSFYDLATAVGLGRGPDGNPGYPLVSIYLTGNELYRVLEISLYLAQRADIFFLQLSGGRVSYDPARTVLFQIPFAGIPIPSFRAVLQLERFTGNGPQTGSGDSYEPIPRGDDTLYHVVCDSYILSFFPRIAKMLPFYKVIPKDREGKEITPGEALIKIEGEELKFWQAVTAYALAQPKTGDGIPRIPGYYARTGTRIVQKHAFPLVIWIILALTLLLLSICLLLWKLRRTRARKGIA